MYSRIYPKLNVYRNICHERSKLDNYFGWFLCINRSFFATAGVARLRPYEPMRKQRSEATIIYDLQQYGHQFIIQLYFKTLKLAEKSYK